MEENEEFKKIVASIANLEKLHHSIDENLTINEKYGVEAEREIEELFSKCVNVLAAKKVSIMKDLAERIANHQKDTREKRTQIDQAIELQRKILETAVLVYKADPNAAALIWKGTALAIPKVPDTIKLILPVSAMQNIKEHVEAIALSTPEELKEHAENNFTVAEEACTFVGSVCGKKDGKRLLANFNCIRGICWNPHDKCLYVCDRENDNIRKVTLQGEVTTFVHGLKGPHGIVMHISSSTFFVTNQLAHSIVKINSSTGKVEVFAGGTEGYQDGKGAKARFSHPRGIAIDQHTGTLYVTDTLNNSAIRKITSQGEVTTLAGTRESGYADGNGKEAKFYFPWGILFDSVDQCLFVCDYGNDKIRRVSLNGEVTTLCAVPSAAFIICVNKDFLISAHNDHKIVVASRQGTVRTLEIKGKGYSKHEYEAICPAGLVLIDSRTCFVATQHLISKLLI